MTNENNESKKIQSREFNTDTGKFTSRKKIQDGASLAQFSPNWLLDPKTDQSRALAIFNGNKDKWLGSADITQRYNTDYNENKTSDTFRPICSQLYSCGFLDRQTEGQRKSLYRLKADIDINDRRALRDQAVRKKAEEVGQ